MFYGNTGEDTNSLIWHDFQSTRDAKYASLQLQERHQIPLFRSISQASKWFNKRKRWGCCRQTSSSDNDGALFFFLALEDLAAAMSTMLIVLAIPGLIALALLVFNADKITSRISSHRISSQ